MARATPDHRTVVSGELRAVQQVPDEEPLAHAEIRVLAQQLLAQQHGPRDKGVHGLVGAALERLELAVHAVPLRAGHLLHERTLLEDAVDVFEAALVLHVLRRQVVRHEARGSEQHRQNTRSNDRRWQLSVLSCNPKTI